MYLRIWNASRSIRSRFPWDNGWSSKVRSDWFCALTEAMIGNEITQRDYRILKPLLRKQSGSNSPHVFLEMIGILSISPQGWQRSVSKILYHWLVSNSSVTFLTGFKHRLYLRPPFARGIIFIHIVVPCSCIKNQFALCLCPMPLTLLEDPR